MTSILAAFTLAATLAVAATVALAVPAGDGEWDSCSASCWYGGSCSASGPAPCTCRCTGFLGLGGLQCLCGAYQMDSPPAG